MNLQDVFDFINFIINKEQSGKYITPREFTLLLRHANFKYFKKYYDVPEEYQVGQPLSRIQWELTTTAKKRLARFMTSATVVYGDVPQTPDATTIYIDTNGVGTYPTNMFYYDFFATASGIGRFVKSYEFESIKTNPVTFPTASRPIATWREQQIHFASGDAQITQFHYLRYPNTPNYAFTVSAADVVTYDPDNSTELDWDEESIWDIIQMILEDAGMGIDRAEVIQYANNRITKGT